MLRAPAEKVTDLLFGRLSYRFLQNSEQNKSVTIFVAVALTEQLARRKRRRDPLRQALKCDVGNLFRIVPVLRK